MQVYHLQQNGRHHAYQVAGFGGVQSRPKTKVFRSLCILTQLPRPPHTVTVDNRSSLMEFGQYVQEMLPKYVQQTQITHG